MYCVFSGAPETFRGIGMASLIILLLFFFIQSITEKDELTGEKEKKRGRE